MLIHSGKCPHPLIQEHLLGAYSPPGAVQRKHFGTDFLREADGGQETEDIASVLQIGTFTQTQNSGATGLWSMNKRDRLAQGREIRETSQK